jgi:hypothetical protein
VLWVLWVSLLHSRGHVGPKIREHHWKAGMEDTHNTHIPGMVYARLTFQRGRAASVRSTDRR